ncbi:MAG: DoxX family protein [Verrucomicrobiota bacterium]
MQNTIIAERTARVVAALILLQTLFFKFTGAPESIHIFSTLGIEPWGRYASGIAELIAAVLLLLPNRSLTALGSLLSLGVISGAILAHLTKLGIVVQNDGGTLFAMALVVFLASAFILARTFRHLPILGSRLPELQKA